jgi:seryl-tRNA synthetase
MKTSLNALHHQDSDWKRELEFYLQELEILSKRLEEVVTKNTAKEVLAQVEHFQNKFIILREQLDILKHDLNEREERIKGIAVDKPEHIDEKMIVAGDKFKERMKDFASSVSDTRYEFNQLLVKVL